jgi:CBS domain-containing protein
MSIHRRGQARMPDATSHLDEPLFGLLRRDLTPLQPDQTVSEALAFLQIQHLGERIVYFYVIDAAGTLVGVVPTRRLLMADPGTSVATIMVRDVFALPTSATVRDASEMFLKHRLLALPVIDAAGRLHGVADVGMLTGDVADVTARENAEDVFQMIGATASQPSSAWQGFLDRFPWLLCNIGGGLIAALIAGWYESLLDAVIVLALFIPVVLAVSESVAEAVGHPHASESSWNAGGSWVSLEGSEAGARHGRPFGCWLRLSCRRGRLGMEGSADGRCGHHAHRRDGYDNGRASWCGVAGSTPRNAPRPKDRSRPDRPGPHGFPGADFLFQRGPMASGVNGRETPQRLDCGG